MAEPQIEGQSVWDQLKKIEEINASLDVPKSWRPVIHLTTSYWLDEDGERHEKMGEPAMTAHKRREAANG